MRNFNSHVDPILFITVYLKYFTRCKLKLKPYSPYGPGFTISYVVIPQIFCVKRVKVRDDCSFC